MPCEPADLGNPVPFMAGAKTAGRGVSVLSTVLDISTQYGGPDSQLVGWRRSPGVAAGAAAPAKWALGPRWSRCWARWVVGGSGEGSSRAWRPQGAEIFDLGGGRAPPVGHSGSGAIQGVEGNEIFAILCHRSWSVLQRHTRGAPPRPHFAQQYSLARGTCWGAFVAIVLLWNRRGLCRQPQKNLRTLRLDHCEKTARRESN